MRAVRILMACQLVSGSWEIQWGSSMLLLLAWLNDLLIVIDWTPGVSSHMSGLISVTVLVSLCSPEKHAGKSPTGHQNMTHPRWYYKPEDEARWSESRGIGVGSFKSSRHGRMSDWGHQAWATVIAHSYWHRRSTVLKSQNGVVHYEILKQSWPHIH